MISEGVPRDPSSGGVFFRHVSKTKGGGVGHIDKNAVLKNMKDMT